MRAQIFFILFLYIGLISIISMIVTIADKIKAGKGAWRVPENTLLLLAALGGSLAMYLTMQVIHHKTRHVKFMWGIPIILLFQAIALYYLFVKL